MKKEKDYVGDIAAIRSMMERTSKFLSLSGWAGIMAGIYALMGAYVAYVYFAFDPDEVTQVPSDEGIVLPKLIALAVAVLVLAIGTAIFLSYKKADKRGERIWNTTSRRLLINMSVPLVAGGILIFVLISKGLIGLVAPFTLVFYGLALYNAGNFTYAEVRMLGLMEIVLGLVGLCFIGYGLLCWAIGFGVLHIIYGIYIHYRYER
ncbi:hypothetical protein GCM10007415_08420 [Parapedobacter pyrenivorans]|uniref:DUF973 family protein n=1 Tax=Parapedobacter pyrenivorans TaxID=1305674 RepID=A0A917HGV9_9SPHI|nr:hypothetical protein [Parapedobacter pyrenivorans]GGG78675.1 hypothetical protein GCM10007415_08420 [Parapedobacter pyrenivorans]